MAKAWNGREAVEKVKAEPRRFDVVLMDVMMPGMDGIRTTMKIRETSSVPIIFLSAKSEDVDKILGLNIGADDYITKPFNPLELVARVKAQLRRYKRYSQPNAPEESPDVFDYGGLIINNATHECSLYGKPVALTPTEFKILWTLCENGGRVVSAEELFEKVWGEQYLDCNNTVMVHIRHLREKIGDDAQKPRFIKNVWGVGYIIE